MGTVNFRQQRRRSPWIIMRSRRVVLHHSRSRSRSMSRNSSSYRMGLRKSSPSGEYDTVDGFGATTAAMGEALRREIRAKSSNVLPKPRLQDVSSMMHRFLSRVLDHDEVMELLRSFPFTQEGIEQLDNAMRAVNAARKAKRPPEIRLPCRSSSRSYSFVTQNLERGIGTQTFLQQRSIMDGISWGCDILMTIRQSDDDAGNVLYSVDIKLDTNIVKEIITSRSITERRKNKVTAWTEEYEVLWDCCTCDRKGAKLWSASNICKGCLHAKCDNCPDYTSEEPLSGLDTIVESDEDETDSSDVEPFGRSDEASYSDE